MSGCSRPRAVAVAYEHTHNARPRTTRDHACVRRVRVNDGECVCAERANCGFLGGFVLSSGGQGVYWLGRMYAIAPVGAAVLILREVREARCEIFRRCAVVDRRVPR